MGETVGLTILLLDLGKERITWETKKAQIKTEGEKRGLLLIELQEKWIPC